MPIVAIPVGGAIVAAKLVLRQRIAKIEPGLIRKHRAEGIAQQDVRRHDSRSRIKDLGTALVSNFR